MTPEQIALIGDSWTAVASRRDEIARAFYQLLFERHPGLREMFAHVNMNAQYAKFSGMVDEIIGLRKEPREFVRNAVALGQRHVAYGVVRDHYAPAGVVLLDTLERTLGDAFTPELRDAWCEGYALLSVIMSRGAERVASAQRTGQIPPT